MIADYRDGRTLDKSGNDHCIVINNAFLNTQGTVSAYMRGGSIGSATAPAGL
ncbi:hypothetical protein HNP38_001192 [Chryseobacterium defluvii]|uniref:Uncharacterized protein n=1 Tax=Chryseobacterium defluvii TaxID=160396 RepID=A0A840KEF8_9FLAO|nr:hypothetical protein [Chryseobacterium defluvii]MBB4805920.1 hypothetical protein [Chryseobacterium defluvii]